MSPSVLKLTYTIFPGIKIAEIGYRFRQDEKQINYWEGEFYMSQAESILIADNEYSFNEQLNRIFKKNDPRRVREHPPSYWKSEGVLEKFNYFFKKEKYMVSKEFEFYSKLAKRDPENTKAHLKMAELYQKKKDQQKAVAEYLLAAEIFCKNDLFPQAMAVYKQVLKQNSGLDHVHLKIADIYRQTGFFGDAFYRYNLLLQQYNIYGEKEKAMEVMGLMAELDPRKFTLEENPSNFKRIANLQRQDGVGADNLEIAAGGYLAKENPETFYDLGKALEAGSPMELKGYKEISTDKVYGFKEIFNELKETAGPSKAYPNFNYHMGVACLEMGFIDEAIEQFQTALEKEQNPFEAAKLLSLCFRKKGWWEEARQALEKTLQVEGVTEEKTGEVKKELDYITIELEREKRALECLNNCSFDHPEVPTKKKGNTEFGSALRIQEALSA